VLPGLVSATDSGLEEVFWFVLRAEHKEFCRKDIVEVNSRKKKAAQ
jgi:hypothetical protein